MQLKRNFKSVRRLRDFILRKTQASVRLKELEVPRPDEFIV